VDATQQQPEQNKHEHGLTFTNLNFGQEKESTAEVKHDPTLSPKGQWMQPSQVASLRNFQKQEAYDLERAMEKSKYVKAYLEKLEAGRKEETERGDEEMKQEQETTLKQGIRFAMPESTKEEISEGDKAALLLYKQMKQTGLG